MPVTVLVLTMAAMLAGARTVTPSFAGTWTIDTAKSTSVGGGRGGGRGTGGGLGLGPSADRLVIRQDEDDSHRRASRH